MRLDVFGCVRIHFGVIEGVWTLPIIPRLFGSVFDDFVSFQIFLSGDVTFSDTDHSFVIHNVDGPNRRVTTSSFPTHPFVHSFISNS